MSAPVPPSEQGGAGQTGTSGWYGQPTAWEAHPPGPVWGPPPPAQGWSPVPPPPAPPRTWSLPPVALVGIVAGAALLSVLLTALALGGRSGLSDADVDRISAAVSEEMYGPDLGAGLDLGITTGPIEQFDPVAPGDLGPDPALDTYAEECFTGDLQSCDDLYFSAPPLSDYEEYGMTCGGRMKPFAAATCTELD